MKPSTILTNTRWQHKVTGNIGTVETEGVRAGDLGEIITLDYENPEIAGMPGTTLSVLKLSEKYRLIGEAPIKATEGHVGECDPLSVTHTHNHASKGTTSLLRFGRYGSGQYALQLTDELGEPHATVSVCTSEDVPIGCIAIQDWGSNAGYLLDLMDAQILHGPIFGIRVGDNYAQVCPLTAKALLHLSHTGQ